MYPYLNRMAAAVVVLMLAGCATTGHESSKRQWREGDIIHYTDGMHYQNSVSIAYPHYHVKNGVYFETHEPSDIHYHVSMSPHGPKQYIRCYAKYEDGVWVHKPQFWEKTKRYQDRGRHR